MDEMNFMDWAVLGTKVLMQVALVIAPLVIAVLQKKKVDGEMISRAVTDAVSVVAVEVARNATAKTDAKTRALELAARSLRKPALKGRSLALAEGVLEGEVHRLKAGSLAGGPS